MPATKPDAPALPVTAAVSPPAKTLPITNFDLAKLAREIAMNINETATILDVFKISEEQYKVIQTNLFFVQCLEEATKTWNSALNTPERIKIEAAAMFEDFMPRLAARMRDDETPLAQVVEAGKLIARVAGVGEAKAGEHAPGEKFTITINMGADNQLSFEKDAKPIADTPILEITADKA